MWTTNLSPSEVTTGPSADWSMPEESMATWTSGSQSTANTRPAFGLAGSAAATTLAAMTTASTALIGICIAASTRTP